MVQMSCLSSTDQKTVCVVVLYDYHVIKTFSDEKILYLTPEQEKDKSHFTDKEVSTTKERDI